MKLKVMTYNIQHCCDYLTELKGDKNEEIRPYQITDAVKNEGADICALNEVYGGQEAEIGAPLGYNCVFAKAIDYWNGEGYGNALVTRFPVLESHKVPIPTDPATRTGTGYYEDRVLLVAKLDLGEGKGLTVFVCHYGLNEDEQRAATDAILAEERKTEGPILLLGDFNVEPTHPLMGELRRAFVDTSAPDCPKTFPTNNPEIKIDYIYTRGVKALGNAVPLAYAYSDHKPLAVEIEI